MDIPHILEELAYDLGELPREAIEAAIAKREQMTPHLLAILQDAIDRIDEVIEDDNYQGHIYALYLLAQFREPLAYPYILKLFSFPGDIPFAIAGDVLTEDLARILASVCGKNIQPLMELIENPLINEYVRAACQMCLVILTGCGTLPRGWTLSYFQALIEERLPQKPSFVWDHLLCCCCQLYPEEIQHSLYKVFAKGLVNEEFISKADLALVLAEDKDSFLYRFYQETDLIDDTVSEIEKWLAAHS